MIRMIPAAALATAAFAQPATAQDYMSAAGAGSRLSTQASSGEMEIFWTKSYTDMGPQNPVLAKVTRILFESECQMAIFFENIDGHFAPYNSPIYVKWSSVSGVNSYGSYMQIKHQLHGGNWGLVVPIEWKDSFKQAAGALMGECGGGK